VELVSESPYQQGTDFVFFGRSGDKPLELKTLLRSFYGALRKIGITEEQRKARKLVYHGLRHTFTSHVRKELPDPMVQRLTGHKSTRMLDEYSHWSLEDFRNVITIQEGFFK
jgi:integrase